MEMALGRPPWAERRYAGQHAGEKLSLLIATRVDSNANNLSDPAETHQRPPLPAKHVPAGRGLGAALPVESPRFKRGLGQSRLEQDPIGQRSTTG